MDQVSFWIGRVSRADTNMEAMLHRVHVMLDPSNESSVPWSTDRKLRNLRKLLRTSPHPVEEVAECLAALEVVAKAHRERNEVLHGHWGPADGGSSPLTFGRTEVSADGGPPSVTWEISEFERCFETLARANTITGAVYKRVLGWTTGHSFGGAWELQTREEMAGRFTLSKINDDGGGIGSFIHFTGEGVEDEMARLGEEHSAEIRRLLWASFHSNTPEPQVDNAEIKDTSP